MENRYATIDTELQHAAANGNLETVETLLNQGVDCNTRNEFGWTSLMQAVNYGHAQVVATLIARGADVNQCNDLGASVVAVACARNDAKNLRLLLESNVRIAATDENVVPPLAVAAANGHEEMIELLLDHGFLPNCNAPYSGVTPLHLATTSLHVRSVRKLLARGADALRKDTAACSLLDLVTSHPWSKDATSRGDERLLKELQIDLRVGWAEDVLECSDSGDCDKMTKLMSELASDPATLELRQQAHALALNTAILQAATHGHQEIAALLVTFGADVNTVRADGRTPLMLAASNGHVVVSRLLLDAGANVFARCPVTGHTAFELASLEDHVPNELLRLLAQRTLTSGPHNILPWTLEEHPAEPRTPQTYPKKMFLFPPSMVQYKTNIEFVLVF
ncbi:hypothetical protein B566_EDAN009204 [Ephemera danica]|nr:hypothetical protein B566_EDAN009204 [Ephemera danica]